MGFFSLFANTTGARNTALGCNSLRSNTTGSDNVAIGRDVLYSNTTANGNTAIGIASLYQNTTGALNTAVGSGALQNNTTASDNTAVGRCALQSNTTGVNNTALGAVAGQNNTTGVGNVYIGYAVCGSSATTNNEIVIGCSLNGVGAGYTTLGRTTGNDYIYNQFTVNASWTKASDERIKKDIETDTLGLNFINNLRTVHYRKKSGSELDPSLSGYDKNDTEQRPIEHGFIAQEVKQALIDSGVSESDISKYGVWHETNNGIQAVSREMFIMPLVNAIKELKAEIDELKNK